jgi:hypothetical protein
MDPETNYEKVANVGIKDGKIVVITDKKAYLGGGKINAYSVFLCHVIEIGGRLEWLVHPSLQQRNVVSAYCILEADRMYVVAVYPTHT